MRVDDLTGHYTLEKTDKLHLAKVLRKLRRAARFVIKWEMMLHAHAASILFSDSEPRVKASSNVQGCFSNTFA